MQSILSQYCWECRCNVVVFDHVLDTISLRVSCKERVTYSEYIVTRKIIDIYIPFSETVVKNTHSVNTVSNTCIGIGKGPIAKNILQGKIGTQIFQKIRENLENK